MNNISNKRQFLKLWLDGELGNRPKIWTTLKDAQRANHNGPIAIRYVGYGHGGPFITNLHTEDLESEMAKLLNRGFCSLDFVFAEQIEPPYRINGEVLLDHTGLSLYYSFVNDLMRPSLNKGGQQTSGLRAKLILKHCLWPADYESLMELVDEYPGHAIEFSGFDRCLGIIPHRRMIIWEVRNY